jgi:hypothetical protein
MLYRSFMVPADQVSKELEEMKEKYPNFKILHESDKDAARLHHAKAFLYERTYDDFEAKFYVIFTPICFLGSNIYKRNRFQYCISTSSVYPGKWKERLRTLETTVNEIAREGIDVVKDRLNNNLLEIEREEF